MSHYKEESVVLSAQGLSSIAEDVLVVICEKIS